MKYDLWDVEARFFFDRFGSEEEALAVVRELLEENGEAYADDLELIIGEGGDQNLTGEALVRRARSLHQRDGALGQHEDRLVSRARAKGDTEVRPKVTAKPQR